MATATKLGRGQDEGLGAVQALGGDALDGEARTALSDELPVSGGSDQRPEYRCECGQGLRVSGLGRHRVYFERGNSGQETPVTNRVCPACGRGLPGKNAP